MKPETCAIDAEGRLLLPKSFANATVIIEQVSETELRIRRAQVIAEDDLPFSEEFPVRLSDSDRDRFLALLTNPPAPTSALNAAAARHRARRG